MKYVFLDTGLQWDANRSASIVKISEDIISQYGGKSDVTIIIDTAGINGVLIDALVRSKRLKVIGCSMRRLYSRENQYESEKS